MSFRVMDVKNACLRPSHSEAYCFASHRAKSGARYPYGTPTEDRRFSGYQIVGERAADIERPSCSIDSAAPPACQEQSPDDDNDEKSGKPTGDA